MPFIQRSRQLCQCSSTPHSTEVREGLASPFETIKRRKREAGLETCPGCRVEMGFAGQPLDTHGRSIQRNTRHAWCPAGASWSSSGFKPSLQTARAAVPGVAHVAWHRQGPRPPGSRRTGNTLLRKGAKAGKRGATPNHRVSLNKRHPQPLYKLLIRHLTS